MVSESRKPILISDLTAAKSGTIRQHVYGGVGVSSSLPLYPRVFRARTPMEFCTYKPLSDRFRHLCLLILTYG